MNRSVPLIVGGGPAGAAAAIHLSKAGVRPIVIERMSQPGDALCGGFLSWRTLEQLERLGLSPQVLAGHSVRELHVFAGAHEHVIALPDQAMGLSRRRLDGLLLGHAREMGALVRTGTAALADGVITLGSGECLASESLFIATGKHDLRGLTRPRSAAGDDPMLGLRLRLPPSPSLTATLTDRIEMHLFRGGYLGIVLQEDGSANFCMAVRKSRLALAGGQPARLFDQLAQDHPRLGDRLAGMQSTPSIDAIGHVPYGWRAMTSPPGVFRLGDQAGVIASLAGEGIGVALASADCAVRFWRAGGAASAPAFQHAFARRLRRPLAMAGLIAGLATLPAVAGWPLALLTSVPGAASVAARMTRVT